MEITLSDDTTLIDRLPHRFGILTVPMQPTPWFEDEAFWVSTYPFIFPDSSFVTAVSDVPKLVALSRCSGGSVLDMCCGPGRYAVPLAKHGYGITGVDRSSFLLEKARAYADQQEVAVTFVQDDMRNFVKPDSFDLALSLFTSFGFFDDSDDNRTALRNLHTSLKPGGVLVMELIGKEPLARIFRDTGSQSLPSGELLFERRSIVGDWERVENNWYIIAGREVRTFRFCLWLFSARELKDLLYSVGFSEVRICGDLDGKTYGPNANRLVAVARKG